MSVAPPRPSGGGPAQYRPASVSDLPYECVLEILRHVPIDQVGRAAAVSRQWHEAAMDRRLWEHLELSHLLPRQLAAGFEIDGPGPAPTLCVQALQFARSLVISNPHYIQGTDVIDLLAVLASARGLVLDTFKLENCPYIPRTALGTFLKHTTAPLRVLSFHGSHVQSGALRALAQNPALTSRLEVLNLSFTSSTDESVRQLTAAHLPRLRVLLVAGNLSVSGESVYYLLSWLAGGNAHAAWPSAPAPTLPPAPLTTLDLRFIWGIQACWVVEFLRSAAPTMQLLDIRGCEHFTKRDLDRMRAVAPAAAVRNSVLLEDDSIEGYRRFVSLLAQQPKIKADGP
ncbi:uncharacterized protein V1510DRAFT_415150 [Dipodascopsis tothii]|uniref:uncharacterized protein n=1 Tax=Dipodascopsis tothii TaxID=44089 RepID=UPI0034CD4510